jgi:hypothetical protein
MLIAEPHIDPVSSGWQQWRNHSGVKLIVEEFMSSGHVWTGMNHGKIGKEWQNQCNHDISFGAGRIEGAVIFRFVVHDHAVTIAAVFLMDRDLDLSKKKTSR